MAWRAEISVACLYHNCKKRRAFLTLSRVCTIKRREAIILYVHVSIWKAGIGILPREKALLALHCLMSPTQGLATQEPDLCTDTIVMYTLCFISEKRMSLLYERQITETHETILTLEFTLCSPGYFTGSIASIDVTMSISVFIRTQLLTLNLKGSMYCFLGSRHCRGIDMYTYVHV